MSGQLSYDPKTLDILQPPTNIDGLRVKYNIHKPQIKKNDWFIVGQQAHGCSRDFILADDLHYKLYSGPVDDIGQYNTHIINEVDFANYIWEVFQRLFYNGILKNIKELCSNELLQKLENTEFLLKKGQEEIGSLQLFSIINIDNIDVSVIIDTVKKGLSVFSALFFAYSVHIISDFFYSVDQEQSFRPLDKIFPDDNSKYLELLNLIIKKKLSEEEEDGNQIDYFKLEHLVGQLNKNKSSAAAAAGDGDAAAVNIPLENFSKDVLKRFIRFCYAKFFNPTSILEITANNANDTIEIILFLFLLYLISDPYVKLKYILSSLGKSIKLLEIMKYSKSVYNSLIGKYCVPKLESFLNGFELSDEEPEILGEEILDKKKIDDLLKSLGNKETNTQYLEDNSEEEPSQEKSAASQSESPTTEEEARKAAKLVNSSVEEKNKGSDGGTGTETPVPAAGAGAVEAAASSSSSPAVTPAATEGNKDREAEADEEARLRQKKEAATRKAEEAADGSGADVEADGSGAALAQLTEEEKAQEARKAAELELTEIIAEAKKTSPDLNLIRVKRAEPLIRLKNILPKGEQPTFLFRNPGDTRNPRPRLQFSNTNNDIEEKIRIAKNAWSSNFNSEEFEEIFQIENINGNDKEITLKSPDTNLSRSELAKIIANNQLTPDELLDVRYLINSAGLNYVEEVENEKCKEQGDYCLDNQPGVLNIISIHVNKKIDPLKKQIKGILPNNHRIELQHPLIKT